MAINEQASRDATSKAPVLVQWFQKGVSPEARIGYRPRFR